MLKALVIATNSSTLKHNNYFKSLGVDLSYHIIEPKYKLMMTEYNEMKFYTQSLMLPITPALHDIKSHQIIRKELTPLLSDLKRLLCPEPDKKLKTKPLLTDLAVLNKEVHLLADIKLSDFSSFDHIFLENSDPALDYLKNNYNDFFNVHHKIKNDDVSFQWMAFRFKSDLNIEFLKSFWFCVNPNYLSIYDNCYYIESDETGLLVWTLLPTENSQEDGFINYYADRIIKLIESEFSFLQHNKIHFTELCVDQVAFSVSTLWDIKTKEKVSLFPPLELYSDVERSVLFSQLNYQLHQQHKKYYKKINDLKTTQIGNL